MNSSQPILIGGLTLGMLFASVGGGTHSARISDPSNRYTLGPKPQLSTRHFAAEQSLRSGRRSLDGTSDQGYRLRSPVVALAIDQWTSIADSTSGSLTEAINSTVSSHTSAVRRIERLTGLSDERIADFLGVTRQSLVAWKSGGPIRDHNERIVMEIADIVDRASMRHVTPSRLRAWLNTPDVEIGYSPSQLILDRKFNEARYVATAPPSAVGISSTGNRSAREKGIHDVLETPLRTVHALEELL